MAYMSLSILWTTDFIKGLNHIRLFSYWLLIPILAFYIQKKDINKIITSFLLGMLLSEIIAYGMYLGFWTIHNHGPEYPSPFMHHIIYSIFLAFTATILLYRLLSKNYSLQSKVFILIFFLSVSGNLFISIGRTGQLAYIITIISVFILHFKFSFKSIISSIALIAIIFSTAYQISPNLQKRMLNAKNEINKIQTGNLSSSWGTRIAFWIISYNMFTNDPLLGVGIGDIDLIKAVCIQKIKNDYKFNVDFCTKLHLHNQFLMILIAGGLVGIILFLLLLYRMFSLSILEQEIKALSILFFIILIVSFMTEAVLYRQFSLALFGLFGGLFIASSAHDASHIKK
jgi:O-antigen ligase